jgi:hypothetical protein
MIWCQEVSVVRYFIRYKNRFENPFFSFQFEVGWVPVGHLEHKNRTFSRPADFCRNSDSNFGFSSWHIRGISCYLLMIGWPVSKLLMHVISVLARISAYLRYPFISFCRDYYNANLAGRGRLQQNYLESGSLLGSILNFFILSRSLKELSI